MAYLKDYNYDIFLSYCHTDNLKLLEEEKGWIESFFHNLRISLWQSIGKRNVEVWWDENRLDGATFFNDSIADAVKSSAILLCLNSPSYLNSEYCKKELDLFYSHTTGKFQSIKIGEQSRIINVMLYHIPHDGWPPEFKGTTGFPFHDAVEQDDQGHPFDISTDEYKEKLQSLCDSLVKLIYQIRDEAIPPPPPPVFDIFFGDVSDNLPDLRTKVINDLAKQTLKVPGTTDLDSKKHKIEIITDIPPPWEKVEHQIKVNEKLEKAELSVHLLDQVPGRRIQGDPISCYPQKQLELSLLTSKPKFIWMPPELSIERIEQEKYRDFLRNLETGNVPGANYKFVRCPQSEVSQHVIDLTTDVYSHWSGIQDGKVAVFIDTHANDQSYAWDLGKDLSEHDIQPFINPQEGDPLKIANALEERIRQVSKLIFFYGRISRDWVIERMNAAVQLVVTKKYPIQEFFVLMLPPHKDPDPMTLNQSAVKITVINNSDVSRLDPNTWRQFFKSPMATA